MFNKLFDKLSTSHLAVLAVGAMFGPGALWAAATFTSVVIQDPTTPTRQAKVDENGRLHVVDHLADLAATPAKYVVFTGIGSANCPTAYTVPAGSALVLTAATVYLSPAGGGGSSSAANLGWSPSAGSCAKMIGGALAPSGFATVPLSFGNGVAIPSGASVGMQTLFNDASATFYGYLVPADRVPAAASAQTASEPARAGALAMAQRRQ